MCIIKGPKNRYGQMEVIKGFQGRKDQWGTEMSKEGFLREVFDLGLVEFNR